MKLRADSLAVWRPLRGGYSACAGFTLLEILLAMTILMIIMVMLTTMFDQSAGTWESGIRETSRALEGRTVVNLIAEDLELAVMNETLADDLPDQMLASGNSISFYRRAEPTEDTRALKLVTYTGANGVKRTERDIKPPYDLDPGGAPAAVLLDSGEVSFHVDGTHTKTLPFFVDVELKVSDTSKAASDIEVRSAGPDGVFGTADDVVD